ncbi:MAG: mechanosensitive ion channel family protein [Candidatus Coatesbacteria bacterium]|nr:MAG: mechanosensitive ion channel family protein [Candidatus Coatesbacteria bacterium]
MITEQITLYTIILSASLVVGGLFIGFVVEKIVLRRLRKIAEKTEWEADDLLVRAPRGLTTLIFGFVGIYAAVSVFPFEESVDGLIRKVLMVVLILLGTLLFSRIAAGLVRMYASKGEVLPTTSIFVNIARGVVLVLGFMIILQALGVSIMPILTALGVGGLAVALALQGTLSNLFAGIQIIATRKIKTGDYIMLESGEKGFVEDITWRNTTIREYPNNLIVIPNSKVAGSIFTNYNMPDSEVSLYVYCGVAYDSDLKKVESVTLDEAKKILADLDGGVADFEPVFRYRDFTDSSIDFVAILRAKEYGAQFEMKHEFIKRLKKRFDKEGIEIPFPVRTVHMKREEAVV